MSIDELQGILQPQLMRPSGDSLQGCSDLLGFLVQAQGSTYLTANNVLL